MNVLDTLLRVIDTQGDIYLPYSFNGDWSDNEKLEIQNVITPYVPERVGASFNNWLFTKISTANFMARKATWDVGFMKAETAGELAKKIADYYSR